MPFKFNPITGQLDLVNSSGFGGSVTGPSPSTDSAIAVFSGTSGTILKDSKTRVQDGGAISGQAFLSRRVVTEVISIGTGESCIAPSLELELTGSIELEPDGELIIV